VRAATRAQNYERLKRLCADDAEALRATESPPPSHVVGDDIEATLIGLIHETSAAAKQAFALAKVEAHPGGSARGVRPVHRSGGEGVRRTGDRLGRAQA
jgi:hypothetical protein